MDKVYFLRFNSYLKKIGPRLTYVDTDSAYYGEIDDEVSRNLNLGESLGCLKNELSQNNFITLQICLAPKTYAYSTNCDEKNVSQFVKNKGFSTKIDSNINSFVELYRNKDSYITVQNANHFKRDRRAGSIHMQKLAKKFNYNYTKRIVESDTLTLPWGYIR